MSDELKPCPFCGRLDTVDPNDNYGGETPFAVACWGDGSCKFIGPEAATKELAIGTWNHRPRERTPEEEGVIRAAVAFYRYEKDNEGGWALDKAVDALLAAQPGKWCG